MHPPDDTAPTTQPVLLHPGMVTPDLDRYRRFYEDVFGFRLVTIERSDDASYRRVGTFADSTRAAVAFRAFEIVADASIARPTAQASVRDGMDHLVFTAGTAAVFDDLIGRLVDAGASSGVVEDGVAVRSVRFVDPDGAHHRLEVHARAGEPGPTTTTANKTNTNTNTRRQP